MFFKFGVASPLLLLQGQLPGDDMKYLMAVETLFHKGAIITRYLFR